LKILSCGEIFKVRRVEGVEERGAIIHIADRILGFNES
jgi:hypothetical protein